MVKKKPDVEKFVAREADELREKERELKRKLVKEVRAGKEIMDEEAEEFKKQVKRHPLEYVAGAFIIGLVMGKLMK